MTSPKTYPATLAFLLLFISCCNSIYAQNIVPNPSFEDYKACPTGPSTLTSSHTIFPTVTNWFRPTDATSDYFNTCSSSGLVGVPLNFIGTQSAYSGNAYCGIILFESWTHKWAEYLECGLIRPMKRGRTYRVKFYVSLGDYSQHTAARIGMHFSDTAIYVSTTDYLPFSEDIVSPVGKYLTDTAKWEEISGSYTAKGGEAWLIIGRFTDTASFNLKSGSYGYAYYYVDNVIIEEERELDTVCTGTYPFNIYTQHTNGSHVWNTSDTGVSISVNTSGSYVCTTTIDTSIFVDTVVVLTTKKIIKDTAFCVPAFPIILRGTTFSNTTYEWSSGDTSSFTSVSANGNYWRTAIDTIRCIVYEDSFDVKKQRNIQADTIICTSTFPITLYGSKDPAINNYYWSTIATDTNITVNTKGTYWLHAAGRCFGLDDTISVMTPPVFVLGNDTDICDKASITIGTDAPGAGSYKWNTGDTICCIIPHEPALYSVTISNECGSISDSINITFTNCDVIADVPKAFSPNGDGVNDILYVRGRNIASVHFMVFDRWGKKVFETNDIKQGWDGTYKGNAQPVETYAWMVKAVSITGSTILKKGYVNLLR